MLMDGRRSRHAIALRMLAMSPIYGVDLDDLANDDMNSDSCSIMKDSRIRALLEKAINKEMQRKIIGVS